MTVFKRDASLEIVSQTRFERVKLSLFQEFSFFLFSFFSSSFFILESHRPFPLFDVSSVENVSRGIENPSLLNFVNGRMQDSLRFSSERASISSWREDDEKDRV